MRPRRHLTCAAVAVLCVAASPAVATAQDVEQRLRALAEENARLYARPVTSGLGAAMNSGWYQGAAARDALGFSLDLRLMGAFVPRSDEHFTPVLPRSVTVEIDGESRTYQDPYGTSAGTTTPSVAGVGDGARFLPQGELRQDLEDAGERPSDYALEFPEGLDLPAVPMLVPQANLGVGQGTEISVRWVPSLEITGEVGAVEAFGAGARHSLSQWLPGAFPLDVAVSAGFQSFDAGDYLSASSRTVQLTVGKRLSILTLYAAGGLEDSQVDVSYTVENPALSEQGQTLSFSQEGANRSRFTAGLSLDVLFLELAADYTVSEYDVLQVSAGLGI